MTANPVAAMQLVQNHYSVIQQGSAPANPESMVLNVTNARWTSLGFHRPDVGRYLLCEFF